MEGGRKLLSCSLDAKGRHLPCGSLSVFDPASAWGNRKKEIFKQLCHISPSKHVSDHVWIIQPEREDRPVIMQNRDLLFRSSWSHSRFVPQWYRVWNLPSWLIMGLIEQSRALPIRRAYEVTPSSSLSADWTGEQLQFPSLWILTVHLSPQRMTKMSKYIQIWQVGNSEVYFLCWWSSQLINSCFSFRFSI